MVLLLVHGRIPAALGCFELARLRDVCVDGVSRDKKDEARNERMNERAKLSLPLRRGERNNKCFFLLVRL